MKNSKRRNKYIVVFLVLAIAFTGIIFSKYLSTLDGGLESGNQKVRLKYGETYNQTLPSGDVLTHQLLINDFGGRKYTPYCVQDCHLLLNITVSQLKNLTKGNSLKEYYLDNDGKDVKASCIKSSGFDIAIVEDTFKEEYEKVCNPYIFSELNGSKTPLTNCTMVLKSKTPYRKVTWKPLTSKLDLEANKSYVIDQWAKKRFGCNVDAVPELFGEKLPYAWWNSSCSVRRPIFVNNTMGIDKFQEPIYVNIMNYSNPFIIMGNDSFATADELAPVNKWNDTKWLTLANISQGYYIWGYLYNCSSQQEETDFIRFHDNFDEGGVCYNSSIFSQSSGTTAPHNSTELYYSSGVSCNVSGGGDIWFQEPSIESLEDNITLGIMIYVDQIGARNIFYMQESVGGVSSAGIDIFDDGTNWEYHQDGSFVRASSSLAIQTGVWLHLKIKGQNALNFSYYVNGTFLGNKSNDLANKQYIRLGHISGTSSGRQYFDNFKWYKRDFNEYTTPTIISVGAEEVLSAGSVPYSMNITLNVSEVFNFTWVNASAIYSDAGGNNGTVYFNLSVNDVFVASYTRTDVSNGSSVSWEVDPNNWSRNDNLSFLSRSEDTDGLSGANSTNITVSNSLPTQDTPTLNSTNGKNLSSENLTVHSVNVVDADNDSVKDIVDWKLNSSSWKYVNMPFEGGSNTTFTRDYSDRSLNGSVTDAVWNSSGGYDGFGAYEFDGLTTSIDLGDVEMGSWSEITISAWFKTNASGFQRIVSKDQQGVKGNFILFVNQTGNINFLVLDTSIGNWRLVEHQPVGGYYTNGSWFQVVATVSQELGQVQLYSHGELEANLSFGAGTLDDSDNENLVIGSDSDVGAVTHVFDGTLDEVSIWNRTLSEAEIFDLFNNQKKRIVSSETYIDENWTACITPNDGVEDGQTRCSNSLVIINNAPTTMSVQLNVTEVFNLTWVNMSAVYLEPDNETGTVYFNLTVNGVFVAEYSQTGVTNGTLLSWEVDFNNWSKNDNLSFQAYSFDGVVFSTINSTNITVNNTAPTHNSPILNSSGLNITHDNLTLQNISTSDIDDDDVTNVYSWFVNNDSVLLLNVPFSRGTDNFTPDYGGYGLVRNVTSNNLTAGDKATYLPNGGRSGDGAMNVSLTGFLEFKGQQTPGNNAPWTITAWAMFPRYTTSTGAILESTNGNDRHLYIDNNGSIGIVGTGFGIQTCSYNTSSLSGWVFLTEVRRALGPTEIYINGTLICSLSGQSVGTNNQILGRGWNNLIDDVQMWNRSLSQQQITALYLNQTNQIMSQETQEGEVWFGCITPVDGFDDGAIACSNNLTIANSAPYDPRPEFNTTTIFNNTSFNVTAYYSDADNENGTLYFNLSVNGSSVAEFTQTNLANGSNVSWFMDSTNWSTFYNLSIKVTAFDGTSTTSNTTNFTVLNANVSTPTNLTPGVPAARTTNQTDLQFYNISFPDTSPEEFNTTGFTDGDITTIGAANFRKEDIIQINTTYTNQDRICVYTVYIADSPQLNISFWNGTAWELSLQDNIGSDDWHCTNANQTRWNQSGTLSTRLGQPLNGFGSSINITEVTHASYNPPTFANTTLNLTCNGSTDPEGQNFTYLFYNNTGLMGNSTTGQFSVTFDFNGSYNWSCAALAAQGDSSNITENFTFTINSTRITGFAESHTENITAGTQTTLFFEAFVNDIAVEDINAIVNYQGVNYPVNNRLANTTTHYLFNVTVNVPFGPTYVNFTWNLTLSMFDSQNATATFNFTQGITSLQIGTCDQINATNILMFNFSIVDIDNETSIENSTFEATFLLWTNNRSDFTNISFDITNANSTVLLCFSPNGSVFQTDTLIRYTHNNYDPREYYFINKTLNVTQNNTEAINLYLLKTSRANGITFNVLDEKERPKQDIYLLVQRYDVGTNTYKLVAMGKTSNEGKDYVFLRKFDQIYRFILRDDSQVLFTSTDQKITTDELFLTITTTTISKLLESFENIQFTGPFWNNGTNTFTMSYSTSDTTVRELCLEVLRYSTDSRNQGVACKQCLTSASGTINCEIERLQGEYKAMISARIVQSPNNWKLLADLTQIIGSTSTQLHQIIGKDGLILTVLLSGTLGAIAISSPAVAGILAILGVIVSAATGIINIGYSLIILLIVILVGVVSRSRN